MVDTERVEPYHNELFLLVVLSNLHCNSHYHPYFLILLLGFDLTKFLFHFWCCKPTNNLTKLLCCYIWFFSKIFGEFDLTIFLFFFQCCCKLTKRIGLIFALKKRLSFSNYNNIQLQGESSFYTPLWLYIWKNTI